MAPKKGAQESSKEIRPIEELAAEAKVPAWQLAGVMSAKNWAKGKKLTLSELQKAIQTFLAGSMTGQVKEAEVKDDEIETT